MLSFSDVGHRCRSALLAAAAVAAVWILLPQKALPLQGARAKQEVPVVEGKVLSAAGAPIPGASLELAAENPEAQKEVVVAKATADQAGNFTLDAPGRGRYALRAAADGFANYVLHDLTLARAERRRLDLVLRVLPTGEPKPSGAPDASVQFSDTPNFTVAGITDRSNMGLHGSDANVRTSDSLAKETAALKSAEKSPQGGAGNTHRLAGDAKEKNGDPVGAAKEYEAAVEADPSEQNYFAWGSELLLHHAGKPAYQVFSTGAKAHPDSPRMLAGLAAAYYSIGQFNEAALEICRASELNPADPAPYLFLGKMEQAAADLLPCSETALSRFAADQPADPQANFLYGLVLWKEARKTQDAAQLARAERLFRRALEVKPDFAEVYLQLGMLYNARGEKDAALGAFEKAVRADPNSSRAHYQLSLAYRRSGDAAKADQEMKTCDELKRSEDAALEKERRELRQFVTILKNKESSATRE
jgi:tetratricopeptide (TPR) repeat protein